MRGVAGRRGSAGAAAGAASSGGEGAVRAGGSERSPGACALERGWGVSGAARQRGDSERSEGTGGALKCLRARAEQRGEGQRGRERGEREREWRKKIKVSGLTQSKLKIFN